MKDTTLLAPVICITGATGFVGSHLLPVLKPHSLTMRVLKRSGEQSIKDGVEIFIGDLYDKNSLTSFFSGAQLIVNLAQPKNVEADERFALAIENLAQAALEAGVRRFLHVSTAMVVGVPQDSHVDELSICRPVTTYERQKLLAERILLEAFSGKLDCGILRPTAVFGEGGQNLLKLAREISQATALRRSLLRFAHGRRRMHLVSVADVVAAIGFLIFNRQALAGNVFLISSDHEPDNNYQAVDSIVGSTMGKPQPKQSLALPKNILRLLLALAGRSQSDPMLTYDANKIKSWGFQAATDFESELQQFARNYVSGSPGR